MTNEELQNAEPGIYWAQHISGEWMLLEVSKKWKALLPVWPWNERYRFTLYPQPFTLVSKLEFPGPVMGKEEEEAEETEDGD